MSSVSEIGLKENNVKELNNSLHYHKVLKIHYKLHIKFLTKVDNKNMDNRGL